MERVTRYYYKLSGVKYHGLQNQGATCYLNSVLQVLFMTKKFREAVKRYEGEHDSFETDLKRFFEKLERGGTDTLSITEGLGIRSGSKQGDAAACFEKILNSLKNEAASRMFKIWLTHKNVCAGCQMQTSTDEQFWHLPLELVDKDYYPFKVEDGIHKFFSESEVTEENQLYCEDCGEKTDSRDKFEMKDHPEVVTLLLKRFKFDSWYNQYVKIRRSVQIPYTLPIQSQKYELYAFLEHVGDLKVGHYTVTIQSEDDEKWYRFNDTFVELLSYNPFQLDPSHRSFGAYLLFYRKKKKTSSQDETSCPAAAKPEANDPSGNAAKTEEKEDEGTTADRKNVVSINGTQHEEENGEIQEKEAHSKNKFHKEVVNEHHSGGAVKDETGRDHGPEDQARAQQHRTGEEQTLSHKPNDRVVQSNYSEPHLTNESEEHREIQRHDEPPQPRGNSPRHNSQTLESQNQIQSDAGGKMRPDLEEEARTKDVGVKRPIEEGGETREKMQRKHWKGQTGEKDTAEGKRDFEAADMEFLTESVSSINLRESTSAKKMDRDHHKMSINVTLAPRSINTDHTYRQDQPLVSHVVCVKCQSLLATIITDSQTPIFIPSNYLHVSCCEPESAVNNVDLSGVPVQTTGPPRTPPAQSRANEVAGQHEHQQNYMSGGSARNSNSWIFSCNKSTDQS